MSFVMLALASICADATAVDRAHAHNDYHHPRPLLDALDQGFCSVEADVFLVDGNLLVGHDREELRADRTLQRLYLEPLEERVKRNGGRVYASGHPFTLLIDIKSEGVSTYRALHDVLARYAGMLTTVHGGQVQPRPVTVVISGNRAISAISSDSLRFVGIDGRLSDLESDAPAHLMPLISDHWGTHFRWDGQGPLPADQRERLQAIVRRVHAAGRRIRFWATPENPTVWKELWQADVDLINTDQLAALREFLLTQPQGN